MFGDGGDYQTKTVFIVLLQAYRSETPRKTLSVVKITLEQVVRSQFFILITREISFKYSVSGEPERFQLWAPRSISMTRNPELYNVPVQ